MKGGGGRDPSGLVSKVVHLQSSNQVAGGRFYLDKLVVVPVSRVLLMLRERITIPWVQLQQENEEDYWVLFTSSASDEHPPQSSQGGCFPPGTRDEGQ